MLNYPAQDSTHLCSIWDLICPLAKINKPAEESIYLEIRQWKILFSSFSWIEKAAESHKPDILVIRPPRFVISLI